MGNELFRQLLSDLFTVIKFHGAVGLLNHLLNAISRYPLFTKCTFKLFLKSDKFK